MTRRTTLRSARVVLAVIAAAAFMDTRRASATSDPSLGGYQGSAAASGLHAFYNLGGVLPLPPPVDIGAPDAYATIATGPATFARASVADPGDLLANPGALLALASSSYKSGTLPPYPYRVTANSGVGAPSAESAPAPGLDARVHADLTGSTASAMTPGADTPVIATVSSMSSTATTSTTGSIVTVHARTEIGHLRMLGLVAIDSIVTDLTVTSDGTVTTLAGGTTITGASVLGQAVAIDAGGVRPSSSLFGGPVGSLAGSLNDLLASAGIHISVASPVHQSSKGSGQIGSDGLRIDLELSERTVPQLKALARAVPPLPNPIPGVPSVADLLTVATARHLVALQLGRGAVSLSARPTMAPSALVAPGPAATDMLVATPGTPPAPSAASSADVPISVPPDVIAAPLLAATPAPPKVPVGVGIGALVLLVLLIQPFVADRIVAASRAVLAADEVGACPWEER